MSKITIDNKEYDLQNATEIVKEQLANVEFVTEMLLQKNNELQVAETAKIGYLRALKRELGKIEREDDQ